MTDSITELATRPLLRGYNSIISNEESLFTALDGTIQLDHSASLESSINVSLCSSASQLAETLETGKAVHARITHFSFPKISAQKDFYKSLHTTAFSVSLVVQARKIINALEVINPRLKPNIVISDDHDDLDNFVARFGDSFIRKALLGGEVQGVYTYFAQSKSQAHQIERELAGGVSAGGLLIGAELNSFVSEVAQSHHVNTNFKWRIRGLNHEPKLTSQLSLLQFIQDFAGLDIDKPQLLELKTSGYEMIPELSKAFSKVAMNRMLFCGDSFGPGLLHLEQQILNLRNQCDWVKETYEAYGIQPDQTLTAQQQQINADQNNIITLKRRYTQSPSTLLNAPTISSLSKGSPRLNVKLIEPKEAAMGGRGGKPFAFFNRSSAIQRHQRIEQIGLRGQARIDQIRLTYTQKSNAFSSSKPHYEEHGGNGGRDLGDLKLIPNNVMVESIAGKTGTRVDNLTITTNTEQILTGGGDKGDTLMSWRHEPNTILIGFRGRAGAELDALQPIVAHFGPLIWETP